MTEDLKNSYDYEHFKGFSASLGEKKTLNRLQS